MQWWLLLLSLLVPQQVKGDFIAWGWISVTKAREDKAVGWTCVDSLLVQMPTTSSWAKAYKHHYALSQTLIDCPTEYDGKIDIFTRVMCPNSRHHEPLGLSVPPANQPPTLELDVSFTTSYHQHLVFLRTSTECLCCGSFLHHQFPS